MKKPALKVIGYVRVSTEGQAESGLGLDAQRKQITAWCEAHGATLVDVAVDAGLSAKNLERPGIQSALRRLHAGEANTLLVAKLDRLTRSIRDLDNLISEHFSEGTGIELVSVHESINTRTAAGRLLVNILGVVAQWERETTAERVTAAMRMAVGKYSTGKLPIGYRSTGGVRADNGKIIKRDVIIDEEGANLVRRIFTMRIAGESLPVIARTIADADTSPKPRAWTVNSVYTIIRNKTYTGQITWGRGQNQITVPRPDLQIVSDEDWQTANSKKQHPHVEKKPRGGQSKYLLSGMLECPECGGSLVVTGGKRWQGGSHLNYFHCNRAKQLKTCSFKTLIRVDRITNAVFAGIRQIVASRDGRKLIESTLRECLDEFIRVQQAKAGPNPAEKIATLENQIRRIIEIQIASDDASPYLNEKRKALEAEIATWRERAAWHPSRFVPPTWDDVAPVLDTVTNEIEKVLHLDVQEGREAVRRVLGRERLRLRRDEAGRLHVEASVYPFAALTHETGEDASGRLVGIPVSQSDPLRCEPRTSSRPARAPRSCRRRAASSCCSPC